MTKAKIFEIFQSVQGEGKYCGVKQVFVRFFECHMHCAWCDTPESIGDTTRNYQEWDLDRLFSRIERLWENSHSVSLTGGEPLLQKDFLSVLLPLLKKTKKLSYLESSGVLYQALAEIIDGVDIISMDMKLPSSTKCREYWKEHREFLKLAKAKDVFIKAVVTHDTLKADVEQMVELISRVDPRLLLILQPNTYDLNKETIQKCLDFQDYCLSHLVNTRVMPQTHKFINVK